MKDIFFTIAMIAASIGALGIGGFCGAAVIFGITKRDPAAVVFGAGIMLFLIFAISITLAGR